MNEELRKRILGSIDFLLERFTEDEILAILDALKEPENNKGTPVYDPNEMFKIHPDSIMYNRPIDNGITITSSAKGTE